MRSNLVHTGHIGTRMDTLSANVALVTCHEFGKGLLGSGCLQRIEHNGLSLCGGLLTTHCEAHSHEEQSYETDNR